MYACIQQTHLLHMIYYVNYSCPSTHNPSLTFRQAAAMASTSTSTRRCSSWAVMFVAPWWTPPGAKDTRSRCATDCTCPTGTAASTPCSPSQVVARTKGWLKSCQDVVAWLGHMFLKFPTPPQTALASVYGRSKDILHVCCLKLSYFTWPLLSFIAAVFSTAGLSTCPFCTT